MSKHNQDTIPFAKFYPFTNDLVFTKVLTNNPELTEDLIEAITGKRARATTINQQEVRNPSIHSDGTRYDIFIVTDENVMYDIEMQTRRQRNLALRTRYYLGVNDVTILQKKEKEEKGIKTYRDLPESNIIFICTFDPFHQKAEVYEAKERLFIDERDVTKEGEYEAKYVKIYLNTSKDVEIFNAKDEKLKNLIQYIQTGKTSDIFTTKIQEEVLLINRRDRGALMTHDQEMEELRLELKEELIEEVKQEVREEVKQEVREQVKEEVREESLEEGLKEGKETIVLSMLKNGVSASDIAKMTGEPLAWVQTISSKKV